jgi:hypothetical protein
MAQVAIKIDLFTHFFLYHAILLLLKKWRTILTNQQMKKIIFSCLVLVIFSANIFGIHGPVKTAIIHPKRSYHKPDDKITNHAKYYYESGYEFFIRKI